MNIYNIYQSALLAQATYALDLNDGLSGAVLVSRLLLPEAGMSQAQAEYFASRYAVVEQQENTDSGFAATLFQDIATGEYHIKQEKHMIFTLDSSQEFRRCLNRV